MAEDAVVFTGDLLDTLFAKTCHGLLRGTSRFNIRAVIDSKSYGKDAGGVLDGKPRGVHVYQTVEEFLERSGEKPKYCIVGVAFPGGYLPASCRDELGCAIENGMSVISGLHQFLSEDPAFIEKAQKHDVALIDIRRPRPIDELHFWNGDIYQVKTPCIAVLGMDCAMGKRTTCRFLMEACRAHDIRAEMIYTGQTGWMQGYPHGFIFDATPNDFVGGEIERVIVECERESSPDLILIEGQSSLRNPSGPCGPEFLLSGNVKGVILQHAPDRSHFVDLEKFSHPDCRIPAVEDEVALIRMYDAETLAIGLFETEGEKREMADYRKKLASRLKIPVIRPLEEGVEPLIPLIRKFMKEK